MKRIIIMFIAASLAAQTNSPPPVSSVSNGSYADRGKAAVSIAGFRAITLGQTMKQTIDAIYADNLMILPSKFVERDVDILGEKSDTFVNIAENKYFKSGYFLFKGDKLYSIRLAFQEKQFTFLDLMTALSAKYGTGRYRDNNTVVWTEGGRELTLERPSTVKYYERQTLSNVAASYRGNGNAATERDALLKGL